MPTPAPDPYAVLPVQYAERTASERDLEKILWRQVCEAVLRSPKLVKAMGIAKAMGISSASVVWLFFNERAPFDMLSRDDLLDRAEKVGVLSSEEAAFLRYWRANDINRDAAHD